MAEIADGASLSCVSNKDIFQASVSSIRFEGNRKGRIRRNAPSDNNGKGIDKTKSSRQEELIALFRIIQLSISKGGSPVSKKRTPSKPIDEQSAESILGALRRHPVRKQVKGISIYGLVGFIFFFFLEFLKNTSIYFQKQIQLQIHSLFNCLFIHR